MYIVAIAWFYVALMMAVAEATNSNGSVLGAIVTFILYGVAPISLVVYLMRSPGRKRAIKAKEAEESSLLEPNTSGHAPTAAEPDSVAPVRKVP
jgi:hypothetical protein